MRRPSVFSEVLLVAVVILVLLAASQQSKKEQGDPEQQKTKVFVRMRVDSGACKLSIKRGDVPAAELLRHLEHAQEVMLRSDVFAGCRVRKSVTLFDSEGISRVIDVERDQENEEKETGPVSYRLYEARLH